MKSLRLLPLLLTSLWFFSCGEKEEVLEPGEHFTRIYDNQSFDARFRPVDIAQTSDGGYVILAKTNREFLFPGAYLLRVDEEGNYEWDSGETPYQNPVSRIFIINDEYYFFAQPAEDLGATHLVKFTDANHSAVEVAAFDISHPLSAARSSAGFLLSYYNPDNNTSALAEMQLDGENVNLSWRKEYPVMHNAERTAETVIEHLLSLDPVFPFYCGETSDGRYYFTTLRDYTFTLILQDPNQDGFGGISGFRDESGVAAALPLEGATFALSLYNSDEKFVLPRYEMDPNSLQIDSDISDRLEFPELASDAQVVIQLDTIRETEVLLYASTTRSAQIVLYAYDPETGELLGSRYWGNTYPYSVTSFCPTSDGGIAIAAETFLAGRFRRIALFKVSERHLAEMAGL